MTRDRRVWLRLGAVCAVISAVTTFLLWWFGREIPPPGDIEAAVALSTNPAYMSRLWVNLIHVFIAPVGYAAAAAILARRAPVAAWGGLACILAWAFAEALGVSINIWGQNAEWRGAWATADAEQRAALTAAMTTFQGFWNGIFFLVLIFFALASALLGCAAVGEPGLGRWVGWLLLAAVPLTLVIMLDGYFGFALGRFIEWSYPLLQPTSRLLMGVWIWQAAASR